MPEPTDQSLTAKADAAFRQADAKVVRIARQTGTPIIVWERGGIRAIDPDEFTAGAANRPAIPKVSHAD
jgi:hypothetical protein